MTNYEWRITKLRLDDSGVEMRFRHWTRNVVQKTNQYVARFVRLNDSVHPAARGAVADIGLLFVTLFHLRAEFLQFLRRRFFVAALMRLGENREHRVRRLRSAHHRISPVRPGNDKSRVIGLAAHCIIASAK